MSDSIYNKNPKKVSDVDMKAALQRAQLNHVSFDRFQTILEIILNTDNMSREEEKQLYQDVFVLYKEQNEDNVIAWAHQHFHKDSVNKDSHDFWLDKRGLMLLHLNSRVF